MSAQVSWQKHKSKQKQQLARVQQKLKQQSNLPLLTYSTACSQQKNKRKTRIFTRA